MKNVTFFSSRNAGDPEKVKEYEEYMEKHMPTKHFTPEEQFEYARRREFQRRNFEEYMKRDK